MCQCKVMCVIALTIISAVTSFNVDNGNFATYAGPDDMSMFGFSVAIHKDHNNGWLIVGAPEAESGQQGVTRGGAVFMCPTDRDGGCVQIPFDTKGDNYDGSTRMDNKTAQWFGATVSASGREDGPVVACAPRYTWFPKAMTRRDPVGTCYVARDSFRNFEEYAPCRTFLFGYHRQGSCQAGFSAAIDRDGDRLFIGAPGSYYWQGQMYSIEAHTKFKYKPVKFSESYGGPGQIMQQSLSNRAAVFQTQIGPNEDDDAYKGYSSVAGDFTGNGLQGVAVGMPKANYLKGRVLIYTWNLTTIDQFQSDQLGSYFGYSVAASDLDGDSKVDLIVGAPLYTLPNTEMKYDVGRVYIFYQQSKKGYFKEVMVIDGFNSKSRFGHAVAGLGDINQDGYGDFAIGAPYDSDDENDLLGSVYIYHGSALGVREKYAQKIKAKDVMRGPAGGRLTTFGFCVTGGLDLDGNEYPDIAVGDYLSNRAYFFRARPVVTLDASLTSTMNVVDIRDYGLSSSIKNNEFNLTYCVKYSGKGIPDRLVVNLEFLLDTNSDEGRMRFLQLTDSNQLNRTHQMFANAEICDHIPVYVRRQIRDKLAPLEVEMKYSLANREAGQIYVRNPRSILEPALDLTVPPSRTLTVMIQNNCGDDKVCTPDLQLKVTSNHYKYLIGNTEPLKFDIYVGNNGEDSFGSTLYITYPENIFFEQKIDKKGSTTFCTPYESNKTVICEIGNPIPSHEAVTFDILWQHVYVEGMLPHFDFYVKVNSTIDELSSTLGDNEQKVTVKLWGDSTLNIRGQSEPSDIYFNASVYTSDISNQTLASVSEGVMGPQVTHIYYLKNEGVTTVNETEIFLIWPSETLGGETLLYLVDEPYFIGAGNVVCDHRELVNPKGLTRDDREGVLERVAQYLQYRPSLTTESPTSSPPVSGGHGPPTLRPNYDEGGGDNSGKPSKKPSSSRPDSSKLDISTITWVSTWGNEFDSSINVNIDYSSTGKGVGGSTDLGQVVWGDLKCYDLKGSKVQAIPCAVGTKYEYYRATREASGQVSQGCLLRNCYDEHDQPITCGRQFQMGHVRYGYVKSHVLRETFSSAHQEQQQVVWSDLKCYDLEGSQVREVPCAIGTNYEYFRATADSTSGMQESGSSGCLLRNCYNEYHQPIPCGRDFQMGDVRYGYVSTHTLSEISSTNVPQFSGHVAWRDLKCYDLRGGKPQEVPCAVGANYEYYRTRTSDGSSSSGCLLRNCYNEHNQRIKCGRDFQMGNIRYDYVNTHTLSETSSTNAPQISGHVAWGDLKCYDLRGGKPQEVSCAVGENYEYYRTQTSDGSSSSGCLLRKCYNEYNQPIKCGRDFQMGYKRYDYVQSHTLAGTPSTTFPQISEQVAWRDLKCYDLQGDQVQEVPCAVGTKYEYYRAETSGGSSGSGCLVRNCYNQYNQPIKCRKQFQIGYIRYGYVKPHILMETSSTIIHDSNQGSSGESGVTVNINQGQGAGYWSKCYETINGNRREVPCGTGFNVRNVEYKCYEEIDGTLQEIPCESGTTYNYHQQLPDWMALIKGCYTQRGNTRYPADCGTRYIRAKITYTFQQTSSEENRKRCYNKLDGVMTEVDCNSGDFGGFTIANPTYKCYEDVNGRLDEKTCVSGYTYRYYQERPYGQSTVIGLISGCYSDVGGRRITADCGGRYTRMNITHTFSESVTDYGTQIQSKCYRTVNGVRTEVACDGAQFDGGANIKLLWGGRTLTILCYLNGTISRTPCTRDGLMRRIISYTAYEERDSELFPVIDLPGGLLEKHFNIDTSSLSQSGQNWSVSAGGSQGGYQTGSYDSSNQRQRGGSLSGTQFSEGAQSGQGGYSYGSSGTSRTGQSSSGYQNGGAHYQDLYGSYGRNGESSSSYDEDDAYEYEEDGRNQVNRNGQNYGQYGASTNEQNGNFIGNAALGQGSRVVTLDLGQTGRPTTQPQRTGGRRIEQRWEQSYDNRNNLRLGRDNVPDGPETNPTNPFGRRKRRSVNGRIDIQNVIKCSNVKCSYITCKIGALESGKEIVVALRSRLNARVPISLTSQQLTISSVMASRVSKLPFVSEQPENQTLHAHEILTNVPISVEELKPDIVPLWVVVLSAVAGTIILLLLILLLYKLGFFKRNRPSSAPERQPLNRNGYNHGDEAL